jgi:hypothetical protein
MLPNVVGGLDGGLSHLRSGLQRLDPALERSTRGYQQWMPLSVDAVALAGALPILATSRTDRPPWRRLRKMTTGRV